MQVEQEHLSGPMTVLSMVNGMIGGLILILPVMALEAGWLLTILTLLVTGFVSYYSSYLCILHTGKDPDLDISIKKHFWNSNKVKIFYQICIWSNLLLIDILYYELIVIQWIGLIPPHQFTYLNPIINFIVLFSLILLIKIRQCGASLMAYGIVSIGAYLLFIFWVVSSEDSTSSASLKLFGGNGIDLAAALGQAFAIQCFFIPILKKNRQPKKYKLYVLIAFVLGELAYAYIALMGSYGIVHREFSGDGDKTIEGYLIVGTWQVSAIELIYLIHLYSVFPEYLLISKKRFFSIFSIRQSQSRTINRYEVLYILIALGFCLLMALLRISLREIIELNGAVIGFFFIYFFPVAIHLKCAYMKPQKLAQQQQKKEQNYAQMVEEKDMHKNNGGHEPQKQTQPQEYHKQQIEYGTSEDKQSDQTVKRKDQQKESNSASQSVNQDGTKCQGRERVLSKKQRICEIIFLSFMLLLGLIVLIQGVGELFQNSIQ